MFHIQQCTSEGVNGNKVEFCCGFDIFPQHSVILGIFHVLVEHLYFLEEMPIKPLPFLSSLFTFLLSCWSSLHTYIPTLYSHLQRILIIYFAMARAMLPRQHE